MTGHLLLYQKSIEKIRQMLDGGEIGELLSLHQERLNLGRARSVENALWSLGVHDIAVLLYLVGSGPTEVTAVGQNALNPEIADDVYVHMRFESGVHAHLHTGWLWPDKRRVLTVIGSKAMIVFDEISQKVVLHKKSIDGELNNVDEGTEVVFENSDPALNNELAHFIECCRTRCAPRSSGESAVEVLRVIERSKL
jgi:predicted dehydrogenase